MNTRLSLRLFGVDDVARRIGRRVDSNFILLHVTTGGFLTKVHTAKEEQRKSGAPTWGGVNLRLL
jgi:hypothetical protein